MANEEKVTDGVPAAGGQTAGADSQRGQLDLFSQVADELGEPEEQPAAEGAEPTEQAEPEVDEKGEEEVDDLPELDEEGDPAEDKNPGDEKIDKLEKMYADSQAQIAALTAKIGEMTAAFTKKDEKPAAPPLHEALANATVEEIEQHLTLPEGVSATQVKLMASLVSGALKHELSKLSPVLNEVTEIKSDMQVKEELVGKYPDLPKYNQTIKTILSKRFPGGVPADKRAVEIEKVYNALKRREKAEQVAKEKNSKQRDQNKAVLGATKGAPADKKKPSFWDRLVEGVD